MTARTKKECRCCHKPFKASHKQIFCSKPCKNRYNARRDYKTTKLDQWLFSESARKAMKNHYPTAYR